MKLAAENDIEAALPATMVADCSGAATTNDSTGSVAINFRIALIADLASVNELIAGAMDSWKLTDRVKRISLPLYRYQPHDLEYLQLVIAETADARIIGVAALEHADEAGAAHGLPTRLLHGLYVAPDRQRTGIASRLLARIEKIARSEGATGLLAKARPEAVSFFESSGFKRLPVKDHVRDYPYRFRKLL